MAKRRAVLGAALVAAAALGVAGSGGAHADAAFTLTAETSGVSLVVFNTSLPLVQSYQANTPSATVTLNARGQATAFSSAPDPGQSVAELPQLLGGSVCGQAPVPSCAATVSQVSYPSAYAQTGDKPKDVALPAVHLHAEATQTASTAEATVGAVGATDAASTATSVVEPDGSQDAIADTAIDGLTLATYLKLSGIHTSATVHRTEDGTLTLSSTFEVGSLSAGGQTFGFKDGQFTLAGQLVPAPVPVQTVLDALKAVGVTGTYLPEQKTATGVTSAGLSLSYVAPAPPTGVVPPLPIPALPVGVGVPSTPTTVTYVLGRAVANGTYKAIPGVGSSETGGSLTGSASTVPSTAATTPVTETPPVATGGETGPTPGGDIPPDTSTGPLASGGDAPVVAPQQPTTTGVVTTAVRRQPVTADALNIYLALVVGALLAFGGATWIRLFGVRRSWT